MRILLRSCAVSLLIAALALPIIASADEPANYDKDARQAENTPPLSNTAMHEDLLPSTFKGLKKKAMVHPSAQQASETMSPAKWKQTFKDVPFSIFAGGVGYGIGRTLADVIGENVARTGKRPGWLKAVPAAMAGATMLGAFTSTHLREGLRKRREAADKK